ncbi:MAG: protein kinase [Myxococcales bacterium]|nr:protein kinase [Myxococcales bacterium]
MLCPSCGGDAGETSRVCRACGTALARPAADGEDNYLGKIIASKYRVEQLIGEGGMGKVYRARQLALDKPVVLKVLRQSLLSDERTKARFQREAKAASRLNHPNSISVLDFGQVEESGALYIAMEYVVGKDLHQILSTEWPLPEARVVRIVGQVLSALADAHSAGVIHRDLKPENIMVEQRRGEPDFVKVLDFGIAKITDSPGEEGPALTRAGFVCGTPEYMSPEQARGAQLDPRSDLYAVGVILYQLCTGLLPFDADSAVGFATKHLTEEPIPPSRRRAEARVSPAMERLILRTMSKDPNDRPQNAEAFRAELVAVDRERRASASAARRGNSSPRIPRRVTPLEQQATRITAEPSWGTERTERAEPPTARRVAVVDQMRPGVDITDPAPSGGGMLLFKLVTVALVAVSFALAGFYVYQLYFGDSRLAPDEGNPNAPMQLGKNGHDVELPRDRPLYEVEIPSELRDREKSERLSREGDEAHQRGREDLAAAKYKEAFEKDPRPEIALKLGELYYQRNDAREARGWWSRHLKDHSASKAKKYIQQAYPDL